MKWIRCEDRMPEEHESIFAKLKGTPKWKPAMFEKTSDDVLVTIECGGERRVACLHTNDRAWSISMYEEVCGAQVVAWAPLPEPYREDEHGETD